MKKIIPISVNDDQPKSRQIKVELGKTGVVSMSVIMTTNCNIKCDFCMQNKDTHEIRALSKLDGLTSDMNAIIVENTLKNILNAIDYFASTSKCNKFYLSLLGGELFQDKYSDEIFSSYDNLIATVIERLKYYNKKYTILLMTNLLMKKVDRLINLAKKHNCDVNASWDSVGRFKKEYHKQLWYSNLDKLKKSGIDVVINIVQSKPNIERVLNDDHEWINLYNNYTINFEPFQSDGANESTRDIYSVDSNLLNEFYLKLYKQYPNTALISNNILRCTKNELSTTCTTIFPHKIVWECCNHYKALELFMNKFNCMSCYYYKICPLHDCVLLHMNDDKCFMKTFLDKIEYKMD